MSDVLFMRRQPFSDPIDGFPVFFEMGENQTASSGYMLMVQAWVIVFLSSPGSSMVDLDGGGDAISILEGGSLSGESINDINVRLNAAAEKTNSEVIRDQIENGVSDPDQILGSAKIISLRAVADDEAEITIQILSQSGITENFVVPVVTK